MRRKQLLTCNLVPYDQEPKYWSSGNIKQICQGGAPPPPIRDYVIYGWPLTGGKDGEYLTSILSWDPVAESWQAAGHLAVAREWHAAVATSVIGAC